MACAIEQTYHSRCWYTRPHSARDLSGESGETAQLMDTSTKIRDRFFLVGCARSGTTLLQSILGSHPDVACFPESWCFLFTVGYFPQRMYGVPVRSGKEALGRKLRELRATLGIANASARRDLRTFLQGLQREELMALFPRSGRLLGPQLRACIRILDRLALDDGKHYWLEKTPMHLGYLDYIERTVPDARVIHIVRSGADNVASLYDATQKYPDPWAKSFPTLDDCIRQWNHSISLTAQHLHKPNHFCVRYETLVSTPKTVVRELCDFLRLPFRDEMLLSREAAAGRICWQDEPWKSGVSAEIRNSNGAKFHTLFSADEQARVLKQIHGVKLDQLPATHSGVPAAVDAARVSGGYLSSHR